MQRIFINKCFLFTVGSVCRVNLFITGSQTLRCWRRGWNGGVEVAETTVKRFMCCGLRRTGKAMGQVYQCWQRICREINFFAGSNEICLTFYIHLWPIYWLFLIWSKWCTFPLTSQHVLHNSFKTLNFYYYQYFMFSFLIQFWFHRNLCAPPPNANGLAIICCKLIISISKVFR
jgi:hypothetical protein